MSAEQTDLANFSPGGLIRLHNPGGWSFYAGQSVFTTTGTEKTIYCPFDTLLVVIPIPVHATAAAAAANGQLTPTAMTQDSDTKLWRPTTANQIVIERIAGTDSGLAFFVFMIGR